GRRNQPAVRAQRDRAGRSRLPDDDRAGCVEAAAARRDSWLDLRPSRWTAPRLAMHRDRRRSSRGGADRHREGVTPIYPCIVQTLRGMATDGAYMARRRRTRVCSTTRACPASTRISQYCTVSHLRGHDRCGRMGAPRAMWPDGPRDGSPPAAAENLASLHGLRGADARLDHSCAPLIAHQPPTRAVVQSNCEGCDSPGGCVDVL